MLSFCRISDFNEELAYLSAFISLSFLFSSLCSLININTPHTHFSWSRERRQPDLLFHILLSLNFIIIIYFTKSSTGLGLSISLLPLLFFMNKSSSGIRSPFSLQYTSTDFLSQLQAFLSSFCFFRKIQNISWHLLAAIQIAPNYLFYISIRQLLSFCCWNISFFPTITHFQIEEKTCYIYLLFLLQMHLPSLTTLSSQDILNEALQQLNSALFYLSEHFAYQNLIWDQINTSVNLKK